MTTPRNHPRLDDPRQAAEHFGHVCNPHNFGEYTLMVAWCDIEGTPLHHQEIVDCDPDAGPSDCTTVLTNLVAMADDADRCVPAGLALALTRPGGEHIQPLDRTWFRAFRRTCHTQGLTPFGVYLVGPYGVRPVHIDDAA